MGPSSSYVSGQPQSASPSPSCPCAAHAILRGSCLGFGSGAALKERLNLLNETLCNGHPQLLGVASLDRGLATTGKATGIVEGVDFIGFMSGSMIPERTLPTGSGLLFRGAASGSRVGATAWGCWRVRLPLAFGFEAVCSFSHSSIRLQSNRPAQPKPRPARRLPSEPSSSPHSVSSHSGSVASAPPDLAGLAAKPCFFDCFVLFCLMALDPRPRPRPRPRAGLPSSSAP